ncbi:aspartate aminotransferase family protein [Ilumatobacter sp.]|uniref:aspartate aminotransferase family protein n=1 Tax=Ilumatobacter sp. TaxID=1967498 RepID=UPI003C3EB0C5
MSLDGTVALARRRYADGHPRSRDVADRARTVLPGGNTRSVLHFDPFPFRVERAYGCELHDIDGHRYVDLLGNYTAGLLGHDPAPVYDAVRDALDGGWSLGSVHNDEVRLAELLVERFDTIERVRFTNSGTEANLMALAVATHHTRRRKIVVFANGYHGGVLTFGESASPVTVPHDWHVCRYNDVDDVTAAFRDRGTEIAAVLVEPMQGSGGCIVGDPAFLRTLRALCDTNGSLLVFDEVMTSRFSRGGAQHLLGIRPDLTTLGKYLAGGFSFGAFGGRADVMAHFDPAAGGVLGHAGTFNNNVVSMSAGVAALGDVLTDDILDATHARGDDLRTAIGESFTRNGIPMCVTGAGSLMNVHGTPGPVASADDLVGADDRLKELFFFHCLDGGYYLARRGFIALSIEVSDAHVAGFLEVVDRFRIDD